MFYENITKNNIGEFFMKKQETEKKIEVTFCKCNNSEKCPTIWIEKDNDTIIIGGDEEGYTRFTKEQFKMFSEEINKGTFDKFI
jgi:hypothetical protein